ncbi:hypothetical protein B0J14DRAFT_151694 [Halenospora varia]|nr:hypothetical protein B0J14DRAFT_151694 [Halenospora varia]
MDEKGEACLGIREWYNPQPGSEVDADIVAIHGFATNPFWTWAAEPKKPKSKLLAFGHRQDAGDQHDEEPIVWLEKFLPKHLPNCRIVSFGYKSQFIKSAPKRDVENCAQELLLALVGWRSQDKAEEKSRPIVFLCHSFGGIIVKEAMIKATLAAQAFGHIKAATHGIIFLGTPHRGSSGANYAETLVSMAKASGLGTYTGLIHTLRRQSPELLKLATYFSDIYDEFEIFCFYEMEPYLFSFLVVDKTSATLEGKPSEGLAANHNELKRFRNENDPNMIKIIRQLVAMVASSKSKRSSTTDAPEGTANETKLPWEQAASLVLEITSTFDDILKDMQTLDEYQSQYREMIAEKYRFQSWAYVVGLVTVLAARQPLHAILHESGIESVCEVLKQITHELIQIKDSQHEGGRSVRSLIIKLQSLSGQLIALIPEQDRGILTHTFNVTILEPDQGLTASAYIADNDAIWESAPDLGALAAMKRIKLLSETSESQREDSGKLSIEMEELDLDKGKSSARTTGLLRKSSQVIVEWKKYEGYWDNEIGNELFRRVENLTYFLKTTSRSSAILNLRLLNCEGYCHDSKKARLGFVYAVPKGVESRQSHRRLNALMKEYEDNKLNSPPVGDRMELAKVLCKTMIDLHTAKWFHKSLSSFNILLFPDVEDSKDDGDSEEMKPLKYTITEPYIVGFNNSRPDSPKEFSEPASGSQEIRRYWHPDYKNVVNQKFTHEFDYYSLGIVLLEIGLWSPLSTLVSRFMRGHESDDASMFSGNVRKSLCPLLRSSIGLIYENVVVDLLEAFDRRKNGEDHDEIIPLGKLIDLQTHILQQIELCRA